MQPPMILSNLHYDAYEYRTTEYLRIKAVFDSIDSRMIKRAVDYMRDSVKPLVSHAFEATELFQYICWVGSWWSDKLLSLATRCNSKHPSSISIRLISKSNDFFFPTKIGLF